MTSRDVERALEILDVIPQEQIERMRASIAAADASLRGGDARPVTPSAVEPDPDWTAVVFYLWSTSDASLTRSL